MNIDEAEIKVRRSSLDAQAPVTDSHGRSAPSRRSASIPVRRADLCPVVPFFFATGWILRRSEAIVVMIQHGSERQRETTAATCLLSPIVKQCCDQVLGCAGEDKGGGFGLSHCSNEG